MLKQNVDFIGHQEHKTTMSTTFESYEFLLMPFGLTNTSATFMTMINHIFHDMLDQGEALCLYDIILYSKDLEEYREVLDKVLKRLKGMFMKSMQIQTCVRLWCTKYNSWDLESLRMG